MIKVQLPQGSIIEIDSIERPEGVVIRCEQQPALANVLTDLLTLNTMPHSPDAELHIAGKIIGYYKDAEVIETSPAHYAPRKAKPERKPVNAESGRK